MTGRGDDNFIIQSHRGAGVLAPENSLEAFELGWSLGCWPEADVRTTRDGVLVAFHDHDFSRTLPNAPGEMRRKGVGDLSWDELAVVNLGGGRRVCRIADAFTRMAGRSERRLYLDVKQLDLAQLAEEVRRHAVEQQVVLASPNVHDLRRWRTLLPDAPTLLWMGGDEPALRPCIDELEAAEFDGITQLQVHVHRQARHRDQTENHWHFTPSREFVGALADDLWSRGILFQALPYDAADAVATYHVLLDAGVRSFATDHPTVTLEAVPAYRAVVSVGDALAAARDTRAVLVESNALMGTGEFFRRHFEEADAIAIADANTARFASNVRDHLNRSGVGTLDPVVFTNSDLYAEHSFVEQVESHLRQLAPNVIPIAVGAGAINDIVKLAAHRTGRPYLCVATAASMDGYSAFGASITFRGSKQTFDCPAPRAVLADLDVIAAAPRELNASGYADLLAKLTAGADWILADALQVEPIDQAAWAIVQRRLREWLAAPEGVRDGDAVAIRSLVEGLMMSGFAMQRTQTSRPASGAEHQFSHLWDMQHHVDPRTNRPPSHGFKVGVATVAVAELYDHLLAIPLHEVDVERAVAQWPSWPDERLFIERLFANEPPAPRDKALEESRAKHVGRDALREQLTSLRSHWPALRQRLRHQLPTAEQLRRMLRRVGAPAEPEQIGITRQRLRDSFRQAYHIRRRFTVLDLAVRLGLLDELVGGMGGVG